MKRYEIIFLGVALLVVINLGVLLYLKGKEVDGYKFQTGILIDSLGRTSMEHAYSKTLEAGLSLTSP